MACSRRWWLAILMVAAAFWSAGPAARSQDARSQATTPSGGKRLALVIGNAAYRSGRLPTAANDAGLLAQTLAQDGFAVTAAADVDARTLRRLVDGFGDEVARSGEDSLVFVYVSGIGVQYGGANYILPADVAIERQVEVPQKAVPFSDILHVIEAVPARARFFVYDLAIPTAVATSEPIPLAAGLRHMQPGNGSLYAFNAAPGMVGRPKMPFYGLYARAWAEALRTPGLRVHALLSRVRLRVAEVSGGAVIPWDNGEVDPDIVFVPAEGRTVPEEFANRPLTGLASQTVFWAAIAEDTLAGYQAFLTAFPHDPLAPRVEAMKAVRLEAANWAESCRANTPAAYWTYMRRYPRGPHYVDVRRRLAANQAALEPPMRFDATELGGLPAPTAEELRIAGRPTPTFAAAGMPAVPPVPDGLLPPPPSEIDLELAPPPLVPAGALPIPVALLPRPSGLAPGVITEPFVPDLGRLTLETTRQQPDGSTLTLAAAAGTVTSAKMSIDGHERTVLQSDPAGKVVSRTTVKRAGDTLTIAQSGPADTLLAKLVARFSLDGGAVTVVTNAAGQIVAEVKSDRRGIVESASLGPASLGAPTLTSPSAPGRESSATPRGEVPLPPRRQADPSPVAAGALRPALSPGATDASAKGERSAEGEKPAGPARPVRQDAPSDTRAGATSVGVSRPAEPAAIPRPADQPKPEAAQARPPAPDSGKTRTEPTTGGAEKPAGAGPLPPKNVLRVPDEPSLSPPRKIEPSRIDSPKIDPPAEPQAAAPAQPAPPGAPESPGRPPSKPPTFAKEEALSRPAPRPRRVGRPRTSLPTRHRHKHK